ncbi:hypothetical protein ACM26W_05365 [Halomonas sp. HK25]|uniref:hypothetical protein n=1 Tax=Halomonas sp. HK25 TaxID=3394321 RepID=UPI0039FC980F
MRLYGACQKSEESKLFPVEAFGYRRITVERPLRLNYQASPERMARLDDEKPLQKLGAPVQKAILGALSERDPEADICLDKTGNPEPDTGLRDNENVPLGESVFDYFEREVKPHVPDAWIDEEKRDPLDGRIGIVGFEIPFNRHFYQFTPRARWKRSTPTSRPAPTGSSR